MSHCLFCADPWRQVLIDLSRRGLRASVVVRHYGLRTSTVVVMLQEARQRGCLPHPTCRYCPVRISAQQVVCGKRTCRSARDRDCLRLRRARFGPNRTPPERQRGGHVEPPGVVWPELPMNPRERNARNPSDVPPPPVRHLASLLGVGNMGKVARDEAISAYLASAPKAPARTASPPQVVKPFLPPPESPRTSLWVDSRAPRKSAGVRPRSTYILAPPMCPRIGSLSLRKEAA